MEILQDKNKQKYIVLTVRLPFLKSGPNLAFLKP